MGAGASDPKYDGLSGNHNDRRSLSITHPTDRQTASIIEITDAAADNMNQIITQDANGESALRMRVAGGGCSGFQYPLALEEAPNAEDLVFTSNGVIMFIDQKSAVSLTGAQIDYVNGLNALVQDYQREDLSFGVWHDIVGDGQSPVCPRALGMDRTLGNPFAVLMRQLLEKLVILHEQRAAGAGRQGVLVVGNRPGCATRLT